MSENTAKNANKENDKEKKEGEQDDNDILVTREMLAQIATMANKGEEVVVTDYVTMKKPGKYKLVAASLSNGKKFVVKISPRANDDALLLQHDTLHFLKHNTKLNVPKVYFYDSNSEIVPKTSLFVMDYIDADSYHNHPKVKNDQAFKAEVNKIIANDIVELHSVKAQGFGSLTNKDARKKRWEDIFLDNYKKDIEKFEKLNETVNIADAGIFKKMHDYIEKAFDRDVFNVGFNGTVIHGNLYDGNILVEEVNSKIKVHYISPLAVAGDYTVDLGLLELMGIATKSFVETYKTVLKVDAKYKLRANFYGVVNNLTILSENPKDLFYKQELETNIRIIKMGLNL